MLVNASLETARTLIIDNCSRLAPETVSILEAVGRVTAGKHLAGSNLPACDQSAVDGYAVAVPGGSERLAYRLVGSVKLGDDPVDRLQPGDAMQVQTGGKLPPGAIAVVPHEKTNIVGNMLSALETVRPGNNIKHSGEDYSEGEQLVAGDVILTAGHIALMAAFGIGEVSVYRQPRVSALCLSTNVVPWQNKPNPGQTRDSNVPLLTALVTECGGMLTQSVVPGINRQSMADVSAQMLKQSDILILTGGTYAENGNEAQALMEQLGARILYWDVPVQPGSHTGAAVLGSRLIFALSGNPAACAVGHHLFVAPAVRAMQGFDPQPIYLKARCYNGFKKKSGSRRFIRSRAWWDGEGWQATVLEGQKPSMLRSLIECNALIDMPPNHPPIDAGQEVSLILISKFG